MKVNEIKEVVRPSMIDAIEYGQAEVGHDNREVYRWLDSFKQLEFYKPFFRTQTGVDHTYFVLDIEVKIVESHMDNTFTRLFVAVEYFSRWIKEHPEYKFLWKFSGGKGLHAIQRIDKRINPKELIKVVKKIFPSKDGWLKDSSFWSNHYRTEISGQTINAYLEIDLSMYKKKQLIRWVYSPYHKSGSMFFSIPIKEWNAKKIIDQAQFHNLVIEPFTIPDFQFYDDINLDTDISFDSKKLKSYITPPSSDIDGIKTSYLELSPLERSILQNMEKDVLDDERYCPCIKKTYFEVKTKRGMFFERVIILRFFASLNYTPKDICHFFRFYINDSCDNHKLDELVRQVSYWYGDIGNPNVLPACNVLRDRHNEFYICDKPCGRSYPLEQLQKNDEGERKTFDSYKSFETIKTHVKKILSSSENTVILKPTRAGVTTTLIIELARSGKRALFLSPTNAIARDTFSEAMEIANNENIRINGAVISANKIACKILKDTHDELDKKYIRNYWKKMIYHSKPQCFKRDGETCKYFYNLYNVPYLDEEGYNIPVIESKGDNCAFATIVNKLDMFEIVFITYQKLLVVIENESQEYRVVRDMLDNFDVIVMDEVSQYTNQKPLDITVRSLTRIINSEGEETEDRNIFDQLDKEKHRLLMFRNSRRLYYIKDNNKRIDEIVWFIDYFKNSYSNYHLTDPLYTANRSDDDNSLKIVDNTLTTMKEYENLEKYAGTYHRIIEEFTKETNEYPYATDQLISLLRSYSFIATVNSTPFKPYTLSFISSPSSVTFIKFIQDFSYDKQIIVTDATMPDIEMVDFFGIPFTKYNVGDPRGTNNLQLIISDNRNVSSLDLVNKTDRGDRYRRELRDFINEIANEHGYHNIIVVSPNKTINSMIRSWIYKKEIPDIDHTYFRSSATIGVRCEKRIMITISSPYSPLGSHLWLAYYFKDLMGLYEKETVPQVGAKLRIMSARSNFYQTIGRAKDPKAVTRSVIYTWGMNGNNIPTNYRSGRMDLIQWISVTENIPQPKIFVPMSRIGRSTLSIVGVLWLKRGKIINTIQHVIINMLVNSNRSRIHFNTIAKKYKTIPIEELKMNLEDISKDILSIISYGMITVNSEIIFVRL